jgi:FkbM family methyltransferase
MKILELTTYAQNREDLYLYALLNSVDKGFYVDVGANHETLHSVTKLFYGLGWSGINIEPNSKLIKEFSNKRKRDINLQIGVSNKKSKMSFREYPDFDGLSTLSEEIKQLNIQKNINFIDYDIPVDTLSSLFAKNNVKEIDFIKVDVEGHELAVLEGNNWKKYRSTVVLFEGTDGDRCISYMKKQNYRLEFFDGLNYYMIDKNKPEISIHQFAGAVLTKGIYTNRELELIKNIEQLNSEINELSGQINQVQKTLKEGLGIKTSLKSLKKSVKRRAKNFKNKV